MNKALLIRAVVCAVFCVCPFLSRNYAAAQAQAAEVEAISKKMFSEGSERFIIAEALKDGFIREGQRFHYKHNDSLITIDGKVVPEPYQKRYLTLLKEFKAANPNSRGIGSLQCDGIYMSNLMDKTSNFRSSESIAVPMRIIPTEKETIIRRGVVGCIRLSFLTPVSRHSKVIKCSCCAVSATEPKTAIDL